MKHLSDNTLLSNNQNAVKNKIKVKKSQKKDPCAIILNFENC